MSSVHRLLNWRTLALAALILAGAFIRLIPYEPALSNGFPHWWNFAPIGAIALFCGARCSSHIMAFVVPLLALFLSDALIGYYRNQPVFYDSTMPWVYASFMIYGIFGLLLRGRRRPLPIACATLAGSLQFFIITNFAVWESGLVGYPKTLDGLMECYLAAVKFFDKTLIGDCAYGAVLFGGFALAEWAFPRLREPVPSPKPLAA